MDTQALPLVHEDSGFFCHVTEWLVALAGKSVDFLWLLLGLSLKVLTFPDNQLQANALSWHAGVMRREQAPRGGSFLQVN